MIEQTKLTLSHPRKTSSKVGRDMIAMKWYRFSMAASVLMLSATKAIAGGLYINEYQDSYQGAAGAGSEALGTDASTAFHNPAAMTQLKGRNLTIGGGLIIGDVQFSPSSATPVPGGDGGQQGSTAPALAAYYTHQLNEKWTAGFGFFSISGAVLDPDDDWAGRFQLQEIGLLTLTAVPTIAYQINDQWSVGAGVGVTFAMIDYDLAAPIGPGETSLNLDGDDFAPVFNFGLHFKPNERLSLGVLAFSGFEVDLGGDLSFNGPPIATGSELEMDFAPLVRAGIAYDVTDEITLLGSFGWEGWSTLDNLLVSTSSGSANIPRNWDDTFHGALGVRIQAAPDFMVQAGIAYDTSPVSSSDRTADTPIDRQVRVAVGAQYDLNEDLSIGASMVFADYGKGRINSPTLVGEYQENSILFAGVNLNYSF